MSIQPHPASDGDRSPSHIPPLTRRWAANWVWHPHAPTRNAWVMFRREFRVDDPRGLVLFISADTRYRAWINDTLIGDGPPQSQPYHQYFDRRDISEHVRPGNNCLAVLVQHQGVQPHTRGGLLAEVLDGRGLVRCATDADWRTLIGPWRTDTPFTGINKIGPFQEHVDLRGIPDGWRSVGCDDGRWDRALVLTHGVPPFTPAKSRVPLVWPWFRMIPRPIEHLVERPVYARELVDVEECLDLAARRAPTDASLSLSQAGRPLQWARVADETNLLRADGQTTMACSDRHRDRVTDGRYDPCVTLDFGRVLTAYAELEIDAPAGAVVEMGYAERLIDGRFNISLECPFADRAVLREGSNRFRPLVWRSFRYLRLRVRHCEQGLRVRAVRAVEVNYPYRHRGTFRGHDRLEKVFDLCRRTVELCSIESVMDTPQREQAQWLGDVAAVTLPCIYACFGDVALPAKFLRQAAMNTRPTGLLANISNVADDHWARDIPDYSLWWVIALWRHYQYTGDALVAHECYPEMQRIMRTHLERINTDGLLEPMFGWVFIDWAHVDVRGISAPYNALFAGACDAAAALAAFKGDRWAQALYTRAADGVRRSFARTFLEPSTGVVADAVDDGLRSQRLSEHANAAAIAFGCLGDDDADRIIRRVFERPSVPATEAQPFFMVVVLEALRKRGRTDLALRLIEERWGQRMLDRGRTSCTEEWYENGTWRSGDWQGFQRTHSHAWSACPAEFLIAGLAGIQILEPGCARLRIHPFKCGFSYEVVYPTPRGDVRIAWDGSHARIDAPDSIELA